MKNLKKKTTCIILLCAMLAATVFSSACGKSAEQTNNPTTANESVENGQNEEDNISEEDALKKLINSYVFPDEDFGGYEFNILIRGQSDEWDSQDIVAEEDSSDAFASSVYNRNVEIEEKFNIKIVGKWATVDTMQGQLKKSVQAGDKSYDAVMLNFEGASASAKNNLLTDLNETPYIDLTQPWWDQSLMAETSVMNKVYYATGEMTIMDNDGTWTMMFNKKMLQDLNLESPYDLVKQGKWTLDKFIEMGKNVSQDLDGDGKFGANDQYAFATTPDSIQGLFFSSGLRIIKKDADDIPYFALTGENTITNLTKISEIIRGSNNLTQLSEDFGDHLIPQAAFEENRALFYAEVMQCVIRLRQMETEFGVIPLPKANEEQENYYTNIHKWASATIAIPSDVDDLERSGLIVEALAHGGMKYMTPAYYDLALKSKYTRDEESSEMLDIIFAGRSADLGYVDNVGSLMSELVNLIKSRKDTYTSTIEKREKSTIKDIDKIITSYEKLD